MIFIEKINSKDKINRTINMIKNPITRDFSLNILGSAIYTLSTQILAYPFISRIVSANEYGLILTLMGIANAIGVAIGNPLNNTRILLQKNYSGKSNPGDFNLIFLLGLSINIVLVSIISSLVIGGLDHNVVLVTFISILILFRAYFTVSYRLVINYKKFLYSSLMGFLGYLIGVLIAKLTGTWGFVFIFGELFTCAYIFVTSKYLVCEKPLRTNLFNLAAKKYTLIMSAALISTMMTYMDRFFIYPFLGGAQVSIYNVASFLGKTGGIILTPIAGVLLTYYAKENNLTIHVFIKRLIAFFCFAVFLYIGILIFGRPITTILYPTLYKESMPYFMLANLASTVFILGNTLQPTLLRYCDSRWQPIIQIVYLLSYLILGVYGMDKFGLIGFCYSVLFSNVLKILFMITVVIYSFSKSKEKGLL
ncbi:MAG: lipopolysaccharide biosynthesis protein [Saccharofermentanales bacterium]